MADEIRVIKKKKGGHGHHGGAWKVAYADFVTAMMAFFLVMWLIGLDSETRRAIAGYFRDPSGILEVQPQGKSPIELEGYKPPTTAKDNESRESPQGKKPKTKEEQQKSFAQTKQTLEKAFAAMRDLAALKDHLTVKIVDEGLRIELVEGSEPLFFELGSARMKPAAVKAFGLIGAEVSKLDNPIVVEGHTDSRPYAHGRSYTNWELSSDRANAARRALEDSGVPTDQVSSVRGYADARLRVPSDPYHFSNRRVSLLLPYLSDKKILSVEGGAVESANEPYDKR